MRYFLHSLALESVHGIGQHFTEHLVSHHLYVPGLFGPQDIAGPSNLQVPQGDSKAGPQMGIFFDGL